jgi:putative SOS response-associated peptidase YedK
MCNLYSLTSGQEAMRQLFAARRDRIGNLPALPAIFPDMMAPVVRQTAEGRELAMMRWGFPPPPNAPPRPVTNVRNLQSPYWRNWLKREHRCLAPATSFCEYTDGLPKVPHWFALGEDRPLFAFAAIWRAWTGERKEAGEHVLFSILTCAPNDVVRPVHAKAMPVLLTTPEECDAWLSAPVEEALALQRPLPSEALKVIATGARVDGEPAPGQARAGPAWICGVADPLSDQASQ